MSVFEELQNVLTITEAERDNLRHEVKLLRQQRAMSKAVEATEVACNKLANAVHTLTCSKTQSTTAPPPEPEAKEELTLDQEIAARAASAATTAPSQPPPQPPHKPLIKPLSPLASNGTSSTIRHRTTKGLEQEPVGVSKSLVATPLPIVRVLWSERCWEWLCKHRKLFGGLALLGWVFFLLATAWFLIATGSAFYRWTRQIHNPRMPFDPYQQSLPYPTTASELSGTILYPLSYPGSSQSECNFPDKFLHASGELVRHGSLMKIHTSIGLVSMKDIRYSLQTHIMRNDFDFLCAQMVGIPLCYCLARVYRQEVSTAREVPQWFDIVGKVNLTCVSLGATIRSREVHPRRLCGQTSSGLELLSGTSGAAPHQEDPNTPSFNEQTPKRFKRVCGEYYDLEGVRYRSVLQGRDAVMIQKIFEVQRGRGLCNPMSLEQTIDQMESEAAASI